MKRILITVCVLVLASLACNALAGTPQPTDNPIIPPVPTIAGNPNPTSEVVPPAPSGGQTLFQDDFSDANSGWPTASDADKSADYSADGQYLIQAITTQQDVWAHPGQNFSDVTVEVDATKSSGPDNNGFGVVCRFQDNDNFYYFMVSSDGFQVIGKYEAGENKYLTADKMQPTSAINAGSTSNHVRGDCNGSTLTLYANGEQLSSVTDTSFTSGDVGVIVGTFDEPNVGVLFDNFVVTSPK